MWQKANRIEDPSDFKLVPTEFREIEGVKLAYKDVGKGELVFCIPPWPSSSFVYIPLSLALQDHFRLVSIDIPGWAGQSDRMKVAPTIENYAKLTTDFINSFHRFPLTRYSLLGYSFGGLICQCMMRDYEIKPRKMVYISTLHSGTRLRDRHGKLLNLYTKAKKLGLPDSVIKSALHKYVTVILPRILHYKDALQTKDAQRLLSTYVRDLDKADVRTAFATVFSVLDTDFLGDYLKEFESLIVYASIDPAFIKEDSEELAKLLDVKPIVVDHADHNHFVFDVNKSADVILNFLLA